jgi:hypothetical protein
MAGKFLSRDAIIDTVKSEARTNAIRKRSGLEKHPLRVTSCGCPDPGCGAYHTIDTSRTIPSPEECAARLVVDNQRRRSEKRYRKYQRKCASVATQCCTTLAAMHFHQLLR